MEIQASRSGARAWPSAEPILLLDQNRARWDQLLIRRGLAALERAQEASNTLGGAHGPYAKRRESCGRTSERNVTQLTWAKARIRERDASDYRVKTHVFTGMPVALREARRFNDLS